MRRQGLPRGEGGPPPPRRSGELALRTTIYWRSRKMSTRAAGGGSCERLVNIQNRMNIFLIIQGNRAILKTAKRRRSILVRSAASEEGPKNPFKGIAVKPLVPASYAQWGVGAEWEARFSALAEVGRSPMAWGGRPCPRGDLFLCMGVLPSGTATRVRLRLETCIAVLPGLRAVNAVCRCSLPCVGMADRRTTRSPPRPGRGLDRSLKPCLQKRLGSGLTAVENT